MGSARPFIINKRCSRHPVTPLPPSFRSLCPPSPFPFALLCGNIYAIYGLANYQQKMRENNKLTKFKNTNTHTGKHAQVQWAHAKQNQWALLWVCSVFLLVHSNCLKWGYTFHTCTQIALYCECTVQWTLVKENKLSCASFDACFSSLLSLSLSLFSSL